MTILSNRVQSTQLPPLVELGELASSTSGCISLGQGAPYYSPPDEYVDELKKLLDDTTIHRYSPDPGIPELRQKISTKMRDDWNITVNSDQVVVTPGANQAFFNVLMTITDPGDEVILLSPYYFNHYMACTSTNVKPVIVPLDDDFSLNKSKLEEAITEKTRAIVFVNPGNPTGAVHSFSDIQVLRDIINKYELLVIADETYEYFTYNDTEHVPMASDKSIKDQVISISSFSKTFGIPGWRLGYYVGNEEIINASIKIQDTIGICAPMPSQQLGILLLKHRNEIIPNFVEIMKRNYNIAVDLIKEIEWLQPTNSSGAYYLFPQQLTGRNTEKLVRSLITKHKIYIVPGKGFGPKWKDSVRLSFANVSPEELKESFIRLGKITIS